MKQRIFLILGCCLIIFLCIREANMKKRGNETKQSNITTQEMISQEEGENNQTQQLFSPTVRVLLNTSNYTGVIHNEVTVTSDAAYVVCSAGKEKQYQAGEQCTIKPGRKALKQGAIRISSSADATLQVLSIQRSYGSPKYHGVLEIAAKETGLTVINEVNMEQYLYAVVPSEMPISYGEEALKVQAVCARSFAYHQMSSSNYQEYGADLEDSVNSQVYNNVAESEESIAAVDATKGQILLYDNNIINTYFFSTSCGHTADANDVWISGAETPVYLSGKLQAETQEQMTLDNDEMFRTFIKETEQYDYFEKDCPWFRWNIKMSAKALKQSINANLAKVMDKVTVKDRDGSFVAKEISTVGKIRDISVSKRSSDGVLMELIITGSKETIKVSGEYAIRTVLGNASADIQLQDGSVSKLAMLPSGYFYIDKEQNMLGKISAYTFWGGGFGHGVGMSQNGVKAMAQRGYTCEQMLSHYYPDAQIEQVQLTQ